MGDKGTIHKSAHIYTTDKMSSRMDIWWRLLMSLPAQATKNILSCSCPENLIGQHPELLRTYIRHLYALDCPLSSLTLECLFSPLNC